MQTLKCEKWNRRLDFECRNDECENLGKIITKKEQVLSPLLEIKFVAN